jgi:hypothetical protein
VVVDHRIAVLDVRSELRQPVYVALLAEFAPVVVVHGLAVVPAERDVRTVLVAFGSELERVRGGGGRVVLEIALTRHGMISSPIGSLDDRESKVGVLFSFDPRSLRIEAGCCWIKTNAWVCRTWAVLSVWAWFLA